jgi:hypothetical protein
MAFIPVDKVAQAELRMLLDDQKVENTLYFHFGTAITAEVLEDLGGALISWWETNIAPLTFNGLVFREVYLTDLTSETGPAATVVPLDTLTGGVGGEQMPNNVSLTISFRTAQRGRSFRGRNYVAGLAQDQVNGNRITSTVADDFVTAYNLLPALATSQSATWVVVSRAHNKAPRTTGVATQITTVLVTDFVVDSQRRRLPGRGT